MRLTFFEADIMELFLRQNRKRFIKCAQIFDEYTDEEAGAMLDKIHGKVIREIYSHFPKPS
jgi:hypothetical protein